MLRKAVVIRQSDRGSTEVLRQSLCSAEAYCTSAGKKESWRWSAVEEEGQCENKVHSVLVPMPQQVCKHRKVLCAKNRCTAIRVVNIVRCMDSIYW